MTTKRKPVVGETLYSLNIGNSARRCEQVLTPMKVISVGRKYFKLLKEGDHISRAAEFHIDSWYEHSEYSADHAIYETEQHYLNEKESQNLIVFIRETFSHFTRTNFTLDQLRRIKAIIDEGKP